MGIRNASKTANNSQIELFDKFYKTVKPTDHKTYKKIVNFTKTLEQD
jgi:hypothetical protein